MEPGDSPYDAFLDEYEPGMTTAEVKAVFDVLRPELTAIVREAGEPADDSFLEGDFPIATQQEFLDGVLRDFGFEEGTYRLDPTVHPFATTFARTRHPDDDALQADQPARALGRRCTRPGTGSPTRASSPTLARSPLYGNASLGLGESQSRTWENLVGRSLAVLARPATRSCSASSRSSSRSTWTTWYRGINRVAPGLIRVDADEVTYSLHIILRFELEQELVAGHARARRPARGLEREDGGAARRRRARRRARRAPGRPLDARRVRLLPHLRARQRPLGADLARRRGGAARPRRAARGGRVRPALRVAAARGSTGTGASSRRWRRSSARSARPRSTRSRTSGTCARRSRGSSRSERVRS